MALLRYFKHIEPSKEKLENVLPEPDGLLTHLLPSSEVIEATNSAVHEVLTKSSINEVSMYLCMLNDNTVGVKKVRGQSEAAL